MHDDSSSCFKTLFQTLQYLYQQNQFVTQKYSYQQYLYGATIDITINIKRENINGHDFRISGGFSTDFSLNVFLSVFNDFSMDSFNKLSMYLLNLANHEISHLKNKMEGKELVGYDLGQTSGIERVRMATEYMLSETEIIPIISGDMVEAKQSGREFGDILKEQIDGNFYNFDMAIKEELKSNPLTKKEVEDLENKVYNTLLERAFSRYPLLKKRCNERN